MDIKDKTALVLGSSKGIGREIGMALANAGANVIFTYFDWPQESQDMCRSVEELAGDHLIVNIDLRNPAEIADLIKQIENKYGALHILINNIERGGMPVVHGPYVPEQWDLEIDTTMKAKWWTVNHALPLMKSSGNGIVINISSIAALVGRSGPAGLIYNDAYAAANRAISSFTETWARQGAPEVRVNELMLGFFKTRHAEDTRGWGILADEEKERLLAHIPLTRTGNNEDVLAAIFFMIEKATYMTGATLRLDGGYPLGGDSVPNMPGGVL